MDASDVIAVGALLVSAIGWVFTHLLTNRQHEEALRRADAANDIAKQALELERSRAARGDINFVQPVRFDPARPGILYEIMVSGVLEEVVFEFKNYAGTGGSCPQKNVGPGEKWIQLRDFDEAGSLPTPGARQTYAAARWRKSEPDDWEESGIYMASKERHSFRLLEQVSAGGDG